MQIIAPIQKNPKQVMCPVIDILRPVFLKRNVAVISNKCVAVISINYVVGISNKYVAVISDKYVAVIYDKFVPVISKERRPMRGLRSEHLTGVGQ